MSHIRPECKAIYVIYNCTILLKWEDTGYSTDRLRIADEWNTGEDIALGILGQIPDFFT